MNYCEKCGAKLENGYCENCKTSLVENANNFNNTDNVDTGSFGWAVLGFFIPIVGLILYLVWKPTKPLSAKKAGIGALVGVIVDVVFTILAFILFFVSVAEAGTYI